MPQTQKKTTPKAAPSAAHDGDAEGVVDRATHLSEDVLTSIESGQQAAIEAVRRFVDTVDEALPAAGGHPSRRQDVIDAALDMSDRLVHTQYEFIRRVVQSAGDAAGRGGGAK